jgi:hypothetical protein
VPPRAKGQNRRPPGSAHRPLLFTIEHIRCRTPGSVLDFAADVLPWVMAELELVYYATAVRRSHGESAAEAFTADVVRSGDTGLPDVRSIAGRHGAADVPVIDLEALTHPFSECTFAGIEEFDRALTDLLRTTVEEAQRGNVDSPLMAALDVLRDTRGTVRQLVEFGGLHPASHHDDFLGSYAPASSMLAAGPPPIRVRQALALMNRGLLRVVGPEIRLETRPELGRFIVSSPRVTGSGTHVECVIDARVPPPDLHSDPAPLTKALVARGLWTEFVNRHAGQEFRTGGVAVTRAPFHPVGRDGLANPGLYVLGVPTENTRWFTQVGSARPGPWGDFIHDADAIAAHALSGAVPVEQQPRATGDIDAGHTTPVEGLLR